MRSEASSTYMGVGNAPPPEAYGNIIISADHENNPEENEIDEFMSTKWQEYEIFEEIRGFFQINDYDDFEGGVQALTKKVEALCIEKGIETKLDLFKNIIERYEAKKRNVNRFVEKIWTAINGDLSQFDNAVFTDLLGFTPKHPIQVEVMPTGIWVDMHGREDFNHAFNVLGGESGDQSQGFHCFFNEEGFSFMARCKEADDPDYAKSTKPHEEAHSIDQEILCLPDKATWPDPHTLQTGTEREVGDKIFKITEQIASSLTWRGIDELLAMERGFYDTYDKQGTLFERGGLYDYFNLNGMYSNDFKKLSDGVDENFSIPDDRKQKLKDFFLYKIANARTRYMSTMKELIQLINKIEYHFEITRAELYVWLALEAAESTTTQELRERLQRMADIGKARTSRIFPTVGQA